MTIKQKPNPICVPVAITQAQLEAAKLRYAITAFVEVVEDSDDEGKAQAFIDQHIELNTDDHGTLNLVAFADSVTSGSPWDYLIDSLNEPHGGDCTGIPGPCSRCMIERLLGINTVTWRNKAEGEALRADYFKSNQEASA